MESGLLWRVQWIVRGKLSGVVECEGKVLLLECIVKGVESEVSVSDLVHLLDRISY